MTSKEISLIKKKIFRGVETYRQSLFEYPDLWEGEEANIKDKIIETIRRFNLFKNNKNKLVFKYFNQIKDENLILYIDLPFCSTRCIFCYLQDFLPLTKKLVEKYIKCLKKEIRLFLENTNLKDKRIKAIFFGGGTPLEIFTEDLIDMLKFLKNNLRIDEETEITIESHPRAILLPTAYQKLKLLKKEGVNRVSVGIQSFDDFVLQLNHRCHTAKEAVKSYKVLREIGFIINIDMMFGLPGQTVKNIKNDLIILNKLRPEAIEYFRLEHINQKLIKLYEEKKELFPSLEELWTMNLLVYRWLFKNKYEQNGSLRENSQYFRHRYLRLKEISQVGFGRLANYHLGLIRLANFTDFDQYFKSIKKGELPIERYKILNHRDMALRSFFLSLLFKKGVNKKNFSQKYGFSINEYFGNFIKKFKKLKLIEENSRCVKLTKIGSYFVHDICWLFLEDIYEVV